MLSTVLTIALGVATTPPAERLEIALVFEESAPASLKAPVVEEAARVWAPYGVALRDATAITSPLPNSLTLRVDFVDTPPAGTRDHALGSIPFRDAIPESTISLYAGTASDLVSAAAASSISHWPVAFHDALMARVLGRALAHEIGHYLLRTREHAATGLMRAAQPILELMEVSDSRLGLSPGEETMVRDVVSAGVAATSMHPATGQSSRCIASPWPNRVSTVPVVRKPHAV